MNRIVKILLLLTIASTATTNLFANHQASATKKNAAPDGGELLGQMAQALKQKPAIELSFNLTAADPTGAVNGSLQGTVQAQGYSFKLLNPQMEIYCDGKSKWIFNKETLELTIFPNDTTQTDLVENPIGFLTSLNTANSQFTHPRKAVETVKPNDYEAIWQIELTPKNKFAAYKSLIITIEKETYLPCIIRYQSTDDSSYTIHIKTIETKLKPWPITNFQIPPSYLRNKEITIIDLR
ncbi:MAG: outer membrane lipoprotein carrier protein LolA [Bacteroidales bacterium]